MFTGVDAETRIGMGYNGDEGRCLFKMVTRRNTRKHQKLSVSNREENLNKGVVNNSAQYKGSREMFGN